MRDVVGRLKAALCSPAGCVLLAAALICLLYCSADMDGSHTSLENRIADALSRVDGAGEVDVIIRTRRENDEEIPCGAVAVAGNARDPIVRAELTQALCALLGLQAADVSVMVAGGGL